MWYRGDLKEAAKISLRKNGYWPAFFVCLIIGLFAGGSTASSRSSWRETYSSTGYSVDPGHVNVIAPLFVSFLVFFLAIAVLYTLFLANPLFVGQARFFMEHRHERVGAGLLFAPFKRGYLRAVTVMFLKDLKIFLWSLLLIIPGIVKSYEYFFVDYLLAENPELSSDRAFELSRRMTDGEKWNIFVLSLSFFGWFLLGAMAFGIGILFVQPYVEATMAELYALMRERALENGWASPDELPGFGYEIDPAVVDNPGES